MITIKDKDNLLSYILSQEKDCFVVEYKDVFPNNEIKEFEFHLLMEQFAQKGLLRSAKRMSHGSYIRLSADIYDFHSHGGFAAQEELLRANIEKLSYELDELSKSSDPLVVDRASKIAGIASSIATVLGLFTK